MNSIIKILLGIMLSVSLVFAYSGGPPDATCGIPPSNTNCTQCHGDFAVNSGNGALILSPLTAYSPGATYDLSVVITDDGQSRWGFELAVLNSSNNQAGEIVVTNPVMTQLSNNPDPMPDFLKQNSMGTFQGFPGATWTFQWVTPPAGTGTVTFYIAGNAADNNGNTQGDYIYTIQVPVDEGESVTPQETTPLNYTMLSNYPNPFNPQTTLTFSLPQPDVVQLALYDALGREVISLYDGQMISGIQRITVDGSYLSSGTYFARLKTSSGYYVRILNLVK